MQVNIHNGERHSLSDAFLDRSTLQRKNLFVKTGAKVQKVLIDHNKRAIGVMAVVKGQLRMI